MNFKPIINKLLLPRNSAQYSMNITKFIASAQFLTEEKTVNSKQPLISVVMPSYNQAEYIERSILSVLNQNNPNYELIIIDGGSTDSSLSIIKKYEKFIKYWVSEPDKGQSHALNKGFKIATGDINCYLNSDDMFLPGAFEFIATEFNRLAEADFIYSNMWLTDAKDNIINIGVALPFTIDSYLSGTFSVPQQSCFWSAKVRQTLQFNEANKICMDAEFFLEAKNLGYSFYIPNNPMPLACFRIHSTSITGNNTSLKYLKEKKKEIARLRQYYIFRETLSNILAKRVVYTCLRICKRLRLKFIL